METKLKQCPFCGSEARMEIRTGSDIRVSCKSVLDCGVTTGWFDTEKEAVAVWNKRIAGEENNENPFRNKSDERNCRCNNCEATFREGDIVLNGDHEEFCPNCGKLGCISDIGELEHE